MATRTWLPVSKCTIARKKCSITDQRQWDKFITLHRRNPHVGESEHRDYCAGTNEKPDTSVNLPALKGQRGFLDRAPWYIRIPRTKVIFTILDRQRRDIVHG